MEPPLDLLAERASGLRHLRYAREIAASLGAFSRLDPALREDDRALLRDARRALEEQIASVSSTVKAYRDFLERSRVHARAAGRVAQWLTEEGPADRGALELAWREEEAAEAEQRARKAALTQEKRALRGALASLYAALAARPSLERRLRAIFPTLSGDGEKVVDVGDDDDDASESLART